MANIKLQNVFSKELIEGQIDAKNIQKEIDIINKEIEKAIEKNSSGQSILKTDSLIKRMNACIQVLSKARQELIKKEALKTKKELLQTLPEDSTELAKKQAKKDFLQAQKELEKARSSLIKEYNRKQIKLAIMEGYIIVTQLREQIIGDAIDYKIMSAGLDGDQVVLFESQPTLAEVLSSSSFDSSSFSLRLIATQEQFDKILKNSENIERISTLKNSVLSQMKRVQLDSEEHNMWERLLKVQKSLQELSGARINYGQLIESFEEYLFMGPDTNLSEVDYIYQLLEKGRNNLAYYLGADVDHFQIKALSTMGGRGRADVATLTNVLNPLKEIKKIMLKIGSNFKEGLTNFFSPKEGQGNIPFKKELEKEIKDNIKQALDKI